MSFGGGTGAGGFVGSSDRFDTHHNSGGGSTRYPSPFFDIGHTYLPTSVKQMFRWCRYYFMTNPLINAVVYKMAEYPITPLVVDEADSDLRKKWENVIEHVLKLRTFLIETGLDYFCYGNSFITINFPIDKYLICRKCHHHHKAKNATYKFRNFIYYLACEQCMTTTEAMVYDHNIKNLRGIKLIRWNPEHLTVEHNEVTGKTDYFFDVPVGMKNDIMMGKRHVIESIPNEFIEALKASKTLRFNENEVFHLKRPTIAQKDQGWGIPLILPVLKDTYYLQILRKAQESIAQQYIVPLRVLFPQAGSSSSDPYSTADLSVWRARIESEIEKWKLDQNYIPILPLPIGNMTIGGEGKALMLHQEMEAWSKQIVAGMHVPIEFVFGGLAFSGSNVSMRMLENQFLGYRTEQLIMCRDFILARVAGYMGWKAPRVHFRRFRMADDLQRIALAFQLNQAQKISDTTLLNEMDYDIGQEEENKRGELATQLENQRKSQLAAAALQGDMQIIQARYQNQAMRIMGQSGAMPTTPPDPQGMGSGAAGAASNDSPAPTTPGMAPPLSSGQQAAPGMPEGSTVHEENAHSAPAQGLPTEVQSPLNMSHTGGGQLNILYLAQRAAAALKKMQPNEMQMQLMNLRGQNPQLYSIVLRILMSGEGSQADSLDPLQSPMAQIKPPRSQAPLV